MPHQTIYLLGANDPEMQAIWKMLRKIGAQIVYASISETRVHPGQAYRADPVPELNAGDTLVLIECQPTFIPDGVNVIVVDHHRPGDPGYDLGPEHYWEASSIGQLHALLGVAPTAWRRLVAAMDHCFSSAVAGSCPEVSGHEVFAEAVDRTAASTGTDFPGVIQRIHHFAEIQKNSPVILIGNQEVKDFRDLDLGEGYSLDLLSAQIAAASRGYTALLRHHDPGDVAEKCSLVGHGTPETIRAFIEEWAPEEGLVHIYGVPVRGYAGGYYVHQVATTA